MQQSNFKTYFSFITLLVLGCQAQAQQGPPAVIKTAEVVTLQMAPTRTVAAYSKAKFITTIQAESSGRVLEIASIGEIIDQGAPLGLIADEEYALRRSELKSANDSQQAQVDFLKSESIRLKSLETKNLTSGTALDKNKADLKTANADLSQAKARLKQLENDISNLTPKAPFKGFVTKQIAQPGQFLNQGQDMLEIMSADEIEILAQLPFKLKPIVQIGAQWEYIDRTGESHMAMVEGYIPAATSNSRQIQVHLEDLANRLLPGEPIQLMVPETLPEKVTAVPRDALVLRRQGAHVFVVSEGKARKVEVTTGLGQGTMIAIEGLLKPGDQVVVRGNERLRDQQEVIVM